MKRIKLYGNKCLCGGKWQIRTNGIVGDFYCSRCNEWQRNLTDDEFIKYNKLVEKRINKFTTEIPNNTKWLKDFIKKIPEPDIQGIILTKKQYNMIKKQEDDFKKQVEHNKLEVKKLK